VCIVSFGGIRLRHENLLVELGKDAIRHTSLEDI
jgi:hypothetical protein